MDIQRIRQLIDLVKETGIAELEIHEGDESVRIDRQGHITMAPMHHAPGMHHVPGMMSAAPMMAGESSGASPAASLGGQEMKAPMVGTFYRSPSPNTDAFVEVGQKVKQGDPLCIIEAMKMMNQIESDKSGEIVAILVENGQPVEFDQPLFIIK